MMNIRRQNAIVQRSVAAFRSELLDAEVVAGWSRQGRSLPPALRHRMQRLLGVDLRTVRIHVGPEPDSIQCAAFCRGEHVYLSPGLYPPVAAWQFAVLAHELSHVVQQRKGLVVNPFGSGTAVVHDDLLESEATKGRGNSDLQRRFAPQRKRMLAAARARNGAVVQCIHYQSVTELGHQYRADPGAGTTGEVGTPGHRYPGSGAITWLENALKAEIVQLNNLTRQASPPPPQPGGRPLPRPPGIDALVLASTAKVQKLRTWLEREDFVLRADGSIDWSLSNKTVVYDHQLEAQGATRIYGKSGKLFSDARCSLPLDTSSMVTHVSGPGFAIYVMSQQGNIHVSTHKLGYRHHSSLLAGGNVAGAGELKTDATGALLWLSNKSGHYAPSPIHLNQVIHQLKKLGVQNTYAVKEFSGPRGDVKKDFASADQYLSDTANGPDSPQYELQKLLAYSVALSSGILYTNDWEWKNGLSGWGVYKRFTQHMVPHKEARQWLKKAGVRPVAKVQSGASR